MNLTQITLVILAISGATYAVASWRATRFASGHGACKSRPVYYGWYAALWCALPALSVVVLYLIIEPRLPDAVRNPFQTGGHLGLVTLARVDAGRCAHLQPAPPAPDPQLAPEHRAPDQKRPADVLDHRGVHDHRHCAVGAIRGHAVLRPGARRRVSVRSRMESANGHPRGSGRFPPAPSARCRCSPARC